MDFLREKMTCLVGDAKSNVLYLESKAPEHVRRNIQKALRFQNLEMELRSHTYKFGQKVPDGYHICTNPAGVVIPRLFVYNPAYEADNRVVQVNILRSLDQVVFKSDGSQGADRYLTGLVQSIPRSMIEVRRPPMTDHVVTVFVASSKFNTISVTRTLPPINAHNWLNLCYLVGYRVGVDLFCELAYSIMHELV